MRLRKDKKSERQKTAKLCAEKRAGFTDAEQLIILDRYGFKAIRERARLAKRMAKADKAA